MISPRLLRAFGLVASFACGPRVEVLEPDDSTDAGAEHALAPRDAGPSEEPASRDASSDPEPARAPKDGGAADLPMAQDPECDLHGSWIARQASLSRALGAPQVASTWYYLEFAQDGDQVVVTRHFDCGVEVHGTVLVQLTPATVRAFIAHNLQAGRKGTMRKAGARCEFSLERFWSVRGADEQRFRPQSNAAKLSIPDLAASNPLPTKDHLDGALDWEKDGQLGVAWQVSGIVSGTRNTVQRDWTEWFTDTTRVIAPAKDWSEDLVARVRVDNEENVLEASSPTVSSGGTSDSTAANHVTLRFLGRNPDDSRAQALIADDPFETCNAIREALPALDEL
ncbi:MAG: hypothetical protein QM778_28930 [Myxococcales bacterium]